MDKKTLTIFGAGLFAIVLLFLIGIIYRLSTHDSAVSMISEQDWSRVAGAEVTDGGIHIKPVGRVITHKDTSSAQPNPPVNVRGSHLKVAGDFRIDMTMSGVKNGATLQLYGQVPIVYDEWRQERESVRLEATSNGLSVRIWDGTSQSSVDERIYSKPLRDVAKITLLRESDRITVKINSQIVGSMPGHRIFDRGTIWVGTDAKLGTDGWMLSTLKASGIGKGRVELVPAPAISQKSVRADTLRGLSTDNPRHIPIGAAVSVSPLFTDPNYKKTVIEQFSMLTPENSMKPQFIHPQKDLYTYQDAESIVDVAGQNDMLVHGHALVLGKANPHWMERTPKSERQKVMIDHINNVVGHFKGRVAQWDVVNEPLSEDDIDYTNGAMGLRKQMWLDGMGEGYIDTAFRTARVADPTAKLYINEFGLEKDGKRWDAFVELVKRLQARDVPLDGIGFESHIYREGDLIDPQVLRQHIQILAGLGVSSRISEIDVLGDDPKIQASQYSDILKLCLEEPSCTSYSTWGITDLYGSTTISDRYPAKLGDSLLWDEHYTPKPALKSMQNEL